MLRKILITFLVMFSMTESSIAYDIKNAKIGSTIIIDWNTNFTLGTDGHAAVVVSEYSNNNDSSFIVGAHGDGVKYDSYNEHIGSYNHLGHFRATSDNYSFKERTDIANAAKKLIGKDYEFLNLYIYDNGFNRYDNIPRSRNIVPSDLRCDGVVEWSTEVSVNSGTPDKSDGFYASNNPFTNKPSHIVNKQVDNVGTPQKPTLSLINNNKVSIQFSKVDGAWSKALYAVYRGEENNYQTTVPKKIHCSSGHNNSYIDETAESGIKYYYLIRVGERTATCNDLPEYSFDDASNWSKASDPSIIKITDSSVGLSSSIIDGAGSIINPSNSCWGCDKDEADMQVHYSNPSTVVFQWKQTSSCPYLDIGILECGSNGCGVSNNETLDVVIHRKKWSSTSATAFKTTLPVTVRKKDSWNTISVTSQKPISSIKKIGAFCSKTIVHSPTKQSMSSSRVNLESGYVWAGNSSIIRRDNPTSTQGDAIYKDVAISLSDNKAITLFQWQPSDTCTSLRLKAGFYPNGDGASSNVKFVDMKGWSNKVWSYRKQCNGRLPCTLNSPSGASGYYIIRVKSDANAIDGNYISAFCQ